jgi:autotransporter-associated beta strand protein
LILVNSNGFTGGATIGAAAVVQVGTNGSLGTFGKSVGNISDNGQLIFNQNNVNKYDGVISGSGQLIQAGTGTLILTGDNGNTGGTTIGTNGTLQLGNGGSVGSVGAGFITNNGVLAINNSSPVIYLTNTIVGSGVLVAVLPTSANTLVLRYGSAGANMYSGGTIVGRGLVVCGAWPEATLSDPTWDGYAFGTGPVTITNNAGIAFAGAFDQLDINSTYTPAMTNDIYIPSGQTGNFLAAARVDCRSIITGSNDSVLNIVIPHQRFQQYMNWSNYYGTVNVSVRSNIDSTQSLIQFGALVDYRVRGTPNMPNTKLHIDPNNPQVGLYSTAGGNWVIGEFMGPNGCVLGGSSFNSGGNVTVVIGSLNSSNYMGGRIVDGLNLVKVGTGGLWLANTTNTVSGQVVITNGIFGFQPPWQGTIGTVPVLTNVTAVSIGQYGTFDSSALGTLTFNSGLAPVGSIYDGYLLFSNRLLQGLGVITGNVVVAYGAGISPGMRSNSMASTWLLTTNMDLSGTLSFTNSSLTFLGSSTNFFKLSNLPTASDPYATNNDMFVVGGNLTLTNTNSMPTYMFLSSQLGGQPLGIGTYKLIKYAGRLDGDATNNLKLIQRIGGVLSSSTTNEIDLLVTDPTITGASLIWKGGFPGGNVGTSGQGLTNYWNLINASNFYNGGITPGVWAQNGSTDVFYAGDRLLFTDWYTNADGVQNPGTNTRVTVCGGTLVSPGWITINSTNNWTFTQSWTNNQFDAMNTNGGGTISGIGGLTKLGSGMLQMLTPNNSFNGPTFLSGGMVVVTNLGNYNQGSPFGTTPYNDPTNLVLSNVNFTFWVTNYVTSTPLGGTGIGTGTDRRMTLHSGVTFNIPFTTNITVLTPPPIGAWLTNQLTLSGTIIGDGGMTMTGGGYMVLNNNTNLYTGPTIIAPNTFQYSSNLNNLTWTNGRLTFQSIMGAWVVYVTKSFPGWTNNWAADSPNITATNTAGNFSISNSSPIWVKSGAMLNIAITNWVLLQNTYYVMASNQVLKGAGLINGSVLVNDTAAVTVGDDANLGTMTFTGGAGGGGKSLGNLNFTNGAINMRISRAPAGGGQNSDKVSASQLLMNGTLNVTNIGDPLQNGDTFALFNLCTNRLGAFATLNLPTTNYAAGPPPWTTNYSYTWPNAANNLINNGTIVVSVVVTTNGPTVPTYGTNITSTVTSTGTMVLAWPADHLGWQLQSQTNPLSIGVKTGLANWYMWPPMNGDSTTNTTIVVPLVKTNPTVFYRLVYPVQSQ